MLYVRVTEKRREQVIFCVYVFFQKGKCVKNQKKWKEELRTKYWCCSRKGKERERERERKNVRRDDESDERKKEKRMSTV